MDLTTSAPITKTEATTLNEVVPAELAHHGGYDAE